MRDNTGELLMTTARGLRRRFGAAMAEHEMTPAQSRALRVVREHGPVRLSVIAERLHIAPRSATEVVDALEARGCVVRSPDPDDRRATRVEATPAGLDLGAALDTARARATREYLARLSTADRHELDRILRLLID